jgi:hypothetical protein
MLVLRSVILANSSNWMKIESGYQIRPARIEELPLLAHIELAAAVLFLDTPYAFLVDAEPLPLDFSLSTFRDISWNAPFYAKLGFRPVDEAELTTGFQQLRLKELEAGLPISERVIMYRVL